LRLSEVIIANLSKKNNIPSNNFTKSQKIANYRKKHSSIRHEYYTMANKYASWDKFMLSFTIPSDVKGKTIKKGRFTKLRDLIKIRAFIAKQINNSDDVKYFMNIELGKAYSNPHIHVQLWVKNNTSANTAKQILTKTVSKFSLNTNRCILTVPQQAISVYDYVIKDYKKELTDKEIWDIETQKKRMRKQLGSSVRFYTKSTDLFTKRIYRILYYSYGILRDKANEYLDFFINNFFYFSKKRGLKISFFVCCFSKLGYIRTRFISSYDFVLVLEVFRFAPGHDPPKLTFSRHREDVFILQVKNLFKGIIMFSFIFEKDIRIRSPCYLKVLTFIFSYIIIVY